MNKNVLSFINDFEDKKWRRDRFHNFIWDNIAETALSALERNSLVDKSYSTLAAAAKRLRLSDTDKSGEGSEIAEIFLYGIMKHHFGALPVVPKIFYKQNSNDNAKGADSVHIVLEGDDFSLWFGEAKFYNSIANARLGQIVTSVYDMLDTSKLDKERSIIANVKDIEALHISSELQDKIKTALKPSKSIDHLKGRLNVPILLIHECNITSIETDMTDDYCKSIVEFHSDRASNYFSRQVAKSDLVHKYEQIEFHIILFPVPKKADLVKSFLKHVKLYRED